MRRRLSVALRATLLAIGVLLLVAVPVLALVYSAPLTITENASVAYDMLPAGVASNNLWMSTNGFMSSTANDTRVETLGGVEQPWLVADNMTWTAVPVPANSQTNLYFTTGNSEADSMDIITGYGGYVTIADDPSLELGDNFTIETQGWIDTDIGNNFTLVQKEISYSNYVSGVEQLTATLFDTPLAETLAPDGAGSETNLPNLVGAATHWQATLTNDGDASYVGTGVAAWNRDLYTANASVIGAGYIIDVDVVMVVRYAAGAGANLAMTALRTNGVTYNGSQIAITNAYVPYTTTYTTNPQTGVAWTWAEVDAMEIGVSLSDAGDSRCTQVYATINYAPTVSVTAINVPSGEHNVRVTADSVNLTISVDSATAGDFYDTAALAGAVADNNANVWTLSSNNTLPYTDYYRHSVNGTLIAWYQPNTIIQTTVLPDRQGGDQPGIITWGVNPAGVGVTLASLVAATQPAIGVEPDDPTRDILPEAEVSDWFVAPAVTGSLLTNPLRPFVLILSDTTTLSEQQAWVWLGIAFVLSVLVLTAKSVRGHHLITGAATAVAIGAMVQQTVFPVWALVFVVVAVIGGIVSERSPSL